MWKPVALTLWLLPLVAMADGISLGPRPGFLIDRMADGPLKTRLEACAGQQAKRTLFSIAHRGAPLQFAEHTVESNIAAARMGAGILECDVTFTRDLALVCRHAQNDLHTSTNILGTGLAASCTRGFTPATGQTDADAECRTSDITLAEFGTLRGKMDAADRRATTLDAYMKATPDWRTDLYAGGAATLMSHAQSIRLFRSLGAQFMPELKAPVVEMPFNGFTQADYAQKLIDEYKDAGIPPSHVWPQSFNLEDVLYWIENEPEFGRQAVYLDGSYAREGWSPMDPATWTHPMTDLKAMGVNIIAPPLWVLVTLDESGAIVPSVYAERARAAGLDIVTWTIERSGPLGSGGGWYYRSIAGATTSDGAMYALIDVLARKVGVRGIFSDWPATVTYYANCMGLD